MFAKLPKLAKEWAKKYGGVKKKKTSKKKKK